MSRITLRSITLFLACFTAVTIHCDEVKPPPSEMCGEGKKPYRASLRHIEGGGIGYSEGYTTLEGFFAIAPQKLLLMPFLDIRGHVFNSGKMAANGGLGIRTILGCRTYGLSAYYDYRNTKKLHYNQVGAGLESLGRLWDFRINGYLPVGKKITSPYNVQFGEFSGHYLFLSQKRQFAMKGADAEVGFHLGKSQNFNFYTAAGPYYYIGQIGPNTWGGKVRLAGMYKDYISVEVSDSFDRTFHNNFQGQITFTLPFGGKSRVRKTSTCNPCDLADAINYRMLQPVAREEIIVVGKKKQSTLAIDPATGLPYFFVFVNNTSSSSGTYESPYHSLAQAQNNSSANNIIYVFPGDGTTRGMDSGIALQASQKFWGSGVNHLIQTTQGTVSIPALTLTSPTITNSNSDTDGNAITLAANNTISGFTIASALNNAIYGTDVQELDISLCTFQNTSNFAIEASFPASASVSLASNQFLNNDNGVFLTLNGTSSLVCSNNTFMGQTSISDIPVEITADSNVVVASFINNTFSGNTTGSVRCNFNNLVDASISLLNNTITNNGTGSQASLGSSLVIIPSGTIGNCTITLTGNTLSGNTSNSLYLHSSGTFTTLAVTASTNTMSNNGGSALILATPVDTTLTLIATGNTITGCNDNGIAVVGSTSTSTGNITISGNTITDLGNSSNGIAINQDFSTLNLTLSNNVIDGCEGSGILSYAPTGIDSLTLNVSDNTINNCQNQSSNAAAGLDIEQYTSLAGSITNNTLAGNTGLCAMIGSSLPTPTTCLTLTGNSGTTDFQLTNPVDGIFNLSPCNVYALHEGTITTSGSITLVQSCPGATPCPP